MIIRLSNPNITNNETTLLSTAVVATNTALTVQNNQGFTANDYVVVGKIGDEGTELRQVASTTSDTTLTVDALKFAHAVNTPITKIDFNQIEVKSATSETGTYAVVGSKAAIEVDQEFTNFADSAGASTTWYKFRFYNSTTTDFSDYSDPVQGVGYVGRALRKILDKIYIQAHDDKRRTIGEADMIEYINDGYQKAINRLMKADHKRFIKQGYVSVKNSYNTGTVAVTSGGTTVTGTDTVWSVSWTGKKIQIGDNGFPYDVASVSAVGTLTLSQAYDNGGTDETAATYTIYQDEYDIYDASTSAVVADFRKIEQVIDEDGTIVNEFDMHRSENGWFLKREGDSLKFCLNYVPSTADAEGKWTVYYLYQPAKLDSMADEPEIPQGFDDLLVDYGIARIKERLDNLTDAQYYDVKFEAKIQKMIRTESGRGNELKGFRLDQNLQGSSEHDADWIDDIYSRKTIGT